MNSAMRINKRGSYIVEATICLPIFIAAVVTLLSIILMFSCIEDAEFIMATELRRASAEAIYTNTSPLLPARVYGRVNVHSQVELLTPTEYQYRASRWGNDELILLAFDMRLNSRNPIGIASSARYRLSGITRAYVGKVRNVPAMSREEFAETGDETTFIFPKAGEKHHKQQCTYVIAACRSTILSPSIRRRYSSCAVCRSKSAANGSLVYVFPNEGEAFHLPSCETLDRNYVEVMKRTARQRGYTACSKCGG